MPVSREFVSGNEFPPALVQSIHKTQQAEVTTLKNQLFKSHGRLPSPRPRL